MAARGRSGVAWVLGAALCQQAPEAGDEAPRRCVLFWLTDTTRADRTRTGGPERPTTPFLERLGREGVVFERCFAQACWTKPSMASILTSRYPSETGISSLFQHLDSRFVTLPEVFRDGGWYTAAFSANPIMGQSLSNYFQGFRWKYERFLDPIQHSSGSARALVAEVRRFLDRTVEWPGFLYVHSVDPHEEYRPAPEFLALFADPAGEAEYRRQWQALLDTQIVQVGNPCTENRFREAQVDPEEFLAYGRALYDADLRANDAAFAELVEHLRTLTDELLVVATSDHGEEFFEHGCTGPGHSLHNELLHVPLVLWAPGLLPAGLRFGEPVRSLDIYPTLVDLFGLEAPADLSGRSLLPWIRAGEAQEGRPIYAEKHEDTAWKAFVKREEDADKVRVGSALAIVEGPWKLILNLASAYDLPVPRHQLYHLGRDPREEDNLAEREPGKVAELEAKLLRWAAENQRRRGESGAVEAEALDPQILETLRALGYVR